MTTNPERDLCPILLETGLDLRQVSLITELPLAVVCGCEDALYGGAHGSRIAGRTPDQTMQYQHGIRIAEEFLWARFIGEPGDDGRDGQQDEPDAASEAMPGTPTNAF